MAGNVGGLDQVRDNRRGTDQGHHGRTRAAPAARLGRYAHADTARPVGREAGTASGEPGRSALIPGAVMLTGRAALARKGKTPQGNEERSYLEASYPSSRAFKPLTIT